MRIDKLELTNFRCFEHRTFTFHPQMNVLIGGNGSGKSALLKALEVAAGAWIAGLKTVRAQEKRNIRLDDVRKTLSIVNNNFEEKPIYPVIVKAGGEFDCEPTSKNNYEWSRELNSRGGKTTSGNAKSVINLASMIEERIRHPNYIYLPLIGSYGTCRACSPPKNTAISQAVYAAGERIGGYQNSLNPTMSIDEFLDWFKRHEYNLFNPATMGKNSEAFLYFKQKFIELFEDFKWIGMLPSSFMPVVQVGKEFLPFEHLSDGQKLVFLIFGDIARKIIQLNFLPSPDPIFNTKGIVLIDEIDMHLHPNWQRKICRILTEMFPSLQFFVSTHSPQIISEMKSENIIYLNDTIKSVDVYARRTGFVLRNAMGDYEYPKKKDEYVREIEAILEGERGDENVYPRAKDLTQKALQDFPNDPDLMYLWGFIDGDNL